MSNDDATNWVTIKIPEQIRDDARDDDRTYGEIMEDGLGSDNRTEVVPVEDALAELHDHGAGSATEIDPDELAETVASRTADRVKMELEEVQ